METDLRQAAIAEAADLALPDDWAKGRRVSRGLTIGDEARRDFGPVVHAQRASAGWRVTIGVPDVAPWIAPGSASAAYAEAVGEVHAPDDDWMLPPAVQSNVCLGDGEGRPALTIVVDLDARCAIDAVNVVRARVTRLHLSDEQANGLLAGHSGPLADLVRPLADIARERQAVRRLDSGNARSIVAAMELLAEEALARFMRARGIPGLFERVELVGRRPRSQYSAQADGTGAEATAPCVAGITRFAAAVNHMQLSASLQARELPYGQAELERLAERLNRGRARRAPVSRQRHAAAAVAPADPVAPPALPDVAAPKLDDALAALQRRFGRRQALRWDTRAVDTDGSLFRTVLQVVRVGTFVASGPTEPAARSAAATKALRMRAHARPGSPHPDVDVVTTLVNRSQALRLPRPEYEEVVVERAGRTWRACIVRVARDSHVTETIHGPWTHAGRPWARVTAAARALDELEPGWWDDARGVVRRIAERRTRPARRMDHETRVRFLQRAAYRALFAYVTLQSEWGRSLAGWDRTAGWAVNNDDLLLGDPVFAHAAAVATRIAGDTRIATKVRLSLAPWAAEQRGERMRSTRLHELVSRHPRGGHWRTIVDDAINHADVEITELTKRLVTDLGLSAPGEDVDDDRVQGHMEWIEDLLLPLIWLTDDPLPALEQPRDGSERRLVVMFGDAPEFERALDTFRGAGVVTAKGEPLAPPVDGDDAVLLKPGAPATESEIDELVDQAHDDGMSRVVLLHDWRGVIGLSATAAVLEPAEPGQAWTVSPADWEAHAGRLLVVPRVRGQAAVDIGELADGRRLTLPA